MAEQAKIISLRDHDTGKIVAPRTTIKALSGEGKKWNYVGFTEDNTVGLIEGTWPCNRNLFDNWYFKNPVNQKGQTRYSTLGYCIDRWQIPIDTGGADLILTSEGLSVSSKTDTFILWQKFEEAAFSEYIGKTMTVSMLLSNGKLYSGSVVYPQKGDTNLYAISVATGEYFVSAYFQYNEQSAGLPSIGLLIHQPSVSLVAAKLELGNTQTLAHKEGDTWVLNEIPNYQQELAKCQRYQLAFYFPTELYSPIGYASAINEINLQVQIPTPVTMRNLPTVSFEGEILLRGGGNIAIFRPENLQGCHVSQHSSNLLTAMFDFISPTLTTNQIYDVIKCNGLPLKLMLDANI